MIVTVDTGVAVPVEREGAADGQEIWGLREHARALQAMDAADLYTDMDMLREIKELLDSAIARAMDTVKAAA